MATISVPGEAEDDAAAVMISSGQVIYGVGAWLSVCYYRGTIMIYQRCQFSFFDTNLLGIL